MVRSYWPNTVQTTNLYLNDNLYASNIAVAGTGFRCDHTLTEEINYFTSFLTGDSRLWVESYETGLNGRILGYNDDYYETGDFNWGVNARVKKSYSQRMWNCFVSRYSSYNTSGHCDLYMRCKNSDIYYPNIPDFPNLKADDAIMSAPYSENYNCISWTGGVVDYWEWPYDIFSPWYVPDEPLLSFDNYYGNNPFPRPAANPPSWNYTRSGATSSNNKIDLWSLDGSYTHASINAKWSILSNNLPANGHPHGYDWESKPGFCMRTFHPRYALMGNDYGNVDKYYKWDGTYRSFSKGMYRVNVVLSSDENKKLNTLLEKITDIDKNDFEIKYRTWKETWNYVNVKIYADPRKYAESKEYEDFLEYCKNQGKLTWPLLFTHFINGDFFVIDALEDLTLPEYKNILEEIRKFSANELNTSNSEYIAPSISNNVMKYIKILLELSDKTWGEIPNYQNEKTNNVFINFNKYILKQNYPNPFNPTTKISYGLPANSIVSVKIYDIIGNEVRTLINDEVKLKGLHSTSWDSKNSYGNPVASGIYFCRLIIGTQIQTIKLVLMR